MSYKDDELRHRIALVIVVGIFVFIFLEITLPLVFKDLHDKHPTPTMVAIISSLITILGGLLMGKKDKDDFE